MNKLQLTKKLRDLRGQVKGKVFSEAEELFKEIESTKVKIKALVKE